MTQLVIGMGEVGKALTDVLGIPGRDLIGTVDEPRDVLHIAYPWTPDFTEATRQYADAYDAETVVVHSTVPVGTCDPEGWVHSPVRGRHPHLADALRTFTKFFGGGGARGITAAMDWHTRVGPATQVPKARTTELGKLWELCAFGLAVALEKAVWADCEDEDEYRVAYRMFTETHNAGVEAMGYPEVRKPLLNHVPGPVGGHCVRQSMTFLDHPLARIVEEAGRDESP